MKIIFYFLVIIAIIYGTYYFVKHSKMVAQERIRLTQVTHKAYDQQLERLQKIIHLNNWRADLVAFQRMNQTIDRQQLQKLFKEVAAHYHINIVEWDKRQNVYAFSLLADLDTDVYEFWQACESKMPGQLQAVSFGLFRPTKPQEKVQGRIKFVNVLEPRGTL